MFLHDEKVQQPHSYTECHNNHIHISDVTNIYSHIIHNPNDTPITQPYIINVYHLPPLPHEWIATHIKTHRLPFLHEWITTYIKTYTIRLPFFTSGYDTKKSSLTSVNSLSIYTHTIHIHTYSLTYQYVTHNQVHIIYSAICMCINDHINHEQKHPLFIIHFSFYQYRVQ